MVARESRDTVTSASLTPAACPRLLPSATEMIELDRQTIQSGTSGLELMERAGVGIAERIRARYPSAQRFVVLCGPGNNGGDGFVITRLLRQHGLKVFVVAAAASRFSEDCLTQREGVGECYAFGGDVTSADRTIPHVSAEELAHTLSKADVIVDALLGTGQRAAPRGSIAELVKLAMAAKGGAAEPKIVAVDIPTGVDCDTGVAFEPHVSADLTCAIQFVKRGMLQYPGRAACGSIEVCSIGIVGGKSVEYSLVTDDSVPRIAARPADVHKGLLGRVLIIGGSLEMPGAPALSALAALRTGAGIVSRLVRKGWSTIPALPEAMFEVVGGSGDHFHAGDVQRVREIVRGYDAVVFGPGLGVHRETREFVLGMLTELRDQQKYVVVDADALNHIAEGAMSLAGIRAVITPHPGEAGRLLGISTLQVQADRYGAARSLAARCGCPVVLKGAGTVLHEGLKGRVVIDGTPYLATPGSGDVLAGVIAACTVRSCSMFDAATTGVWLHAKAGVRAAAVSEGPILASDIAAHLTPFVRHVEPSC